MSVEIPSYRISTKSETWFIWYMEKFTYDLVWTKLYYESVWLKIRYAQELLVSLQHRIARIFVRRFRPWLVGHRQTDKYDLHIRLSYFLYNNGKSFTWEPYHIQRDNKVNSALPLSQSFHSNSRHVSATQGHHHVYVMNCVNCYTVT
jgi:hypothetical protein